MSKDPNEVIEERDIDPVTLQVIGGELDTIAQEIGLKLIRSAMSSIIRESEDIGSGILTADGRQIAEGDFTPMQVGTLIPTVKGLYETMEERGKDPNDVINEGDVFIHNHPHYGAAHSPDVAVLVPVFYEGEHIAWTANDAHHLDIGAATPGLAVDLEDVYAEGTLFKATKVYDQGEKVDEIWDFIEENVRTPRIVMSDLQAQVSCAEIGKDRFLSLIDEHGYERVMEASEDLLAYGEAQMRSEISEVPDGVYHETAHFDDDGRNRGEKIHVDVKVKVEGSELTIDLNDSDDEVMTAFNVPYGGSTKSASYFIIRTILTDTYTHDEYIPQNSGTFAPINVEARKGSIWNPSMPRSATARINQVDMLGDLVLKALNSAIPEKTAAGSGPHCYFTSYSGVDENDKYWVYIEVNESAYGGRPDKDGIDAVDALIHNTQNRPVEDVELSHPMRVDHYRLRENAHGPGKHRGGHGHERMVTFLNEASVTVEGEGNTYGSWGAKGGKGAPPGELKHIKSNGEVIDMHSKVSGYKFSEGDKFSIKSIGGGGYGDPYERPIEKVVADYEDDLINKEIAREEYGVVIEGEKANYEKSREIRDE